eukprot:SAG31_NODE_3212_length_4544_cov_1.849719_8_plen_83_part_00
MNAYTGSVRREEKLVRQALGLQRQIFHELSLDVYEATAAAYKLALASGRLDAALRDMLGMVKFLRMAYRHVPAHPMLGIQRK